MSEMHINSGGSRERRLTAELAAKDREIARLCAIREEGMRLSARQAREIAALREALAEARGWVQDDVDADHRHRGQDVLDRIDAVLNGSPAAAEIDKDWDMKMPRIEWPPTTPDPAEAMRAKCEEIVEAELVDSAEAAHPDDGDVYAAASAAYYALRTVRTRIAALKGNGEGK
jgi:hypothetical protein